jgi:hypothetical protein
MAECLDDRLHDEILEEEGYALASCDHRVAAVVYDHPNGEWEEVPRIFDGISDLLDFCEGGYVRIVALGWTREWDMGDNSPILDPNSEVVLQGGTACPLTLAVAARVAGW